MDHKIKPSRFHGRCSKKLYFFQSYSVLRHGVIEVDQGGYIVNGDEFADVLMREFNLIPLKILFELFFSLT
jgi:hypothetical protein